jgi:integrase/recombinase XerD
MRLSTTVHDFVLHLRMEGKAKATIIAYESDLNLLVALASVSAGDSVLAFTPALVRDYLLALSRRDLAMSTLHRRRASVGEFAKWGLRRRLWAYDPMADAPTIKRPKHLPRPFTREEHARLMAVPLTGRALVLRGLLYYGGLRISEALTVRVRDAMLGDEDHLPTLRVRGKGNKERVIPIFPELRAVLADFFLEHLTETKAERAMNEPVIMQANGRPWSRLMGERRMHEWGRAAKVEDCVPHRLRHTCGTHLHDAGWDLRDIQEFMGHADVSTTVLYTQVTAKHLTATAKRLPLTVACSAAPPSGAP